MQLSDKDGMISVPLINTLVGKKFGNTLKGPMYFDGKIPSVTCLKH